MKLFLFLVFALAVFARDQLAREDDLSLSDSLADLLEERLAEIEAGEEEDVALACAGMCVMVGGVVGRYVVRHGVRQFVRIKGGRIIRDIFQRRRGRRGFFGRL